MYKVIQGDTFDSISRKQYGTENRASEIQKANPGVSEPLMEGTTLAIPSDPSAPKNVLQVAPDTSVSEVAIKVDGKRFRFWDSVNITSSVDTISTVEFGAPFDADSADFREAFRPFSYKEIEVSVGGEPLLTGTMVAVVPTLDTAKLTLSVSGYSKPGVLNDCTPPASAFPLEFNGQSILEIAKTLASPFGINVILAEGTTQGPVFERVACAPGKKVLAFLTELAKQRNLIISNSTRGDLVFLQSVESGAPVASFEQGASPVVSVTPFFNPQDYYSHITGIEPVIIGLKGSQFTVKNSRLLGVTRPMTFEAPDTIDSDVKEAVSAKASRMFGNMVSYAVLVDTWRDPSGKLWTPNTTVKLQAKNAMIYTDYEFVIRSVEYTRDSNSETATLNLVIPGAFSGEIPKELPWDE